MAALAAVTIALAAAPAAGAWTEPADVPDVGTFRSRLGVDAGGRAVVASLAFQGNPVILRVTSRSPAGVFGPVAQVSDDGAVAVREPDLAVAADGHAIITWLARVDGVLRVHARLRTPAGALGPLLLLSPAGGEAAVPRAGIDEQANAVVVWGRFRGHQRRVEVATVSVAGVVGPVLDVSGPDAGRRAPEVTVAPSGEAALTWLPRRGGRRVLMTRTLSRGRLGRRARVSPAGVDVSNALVGIGRPGEVVFGWERDRGNDVYDLQMRARRHRHLGRVSEVLRRSGQVALDGMGVDAAGRALIVWDRVALESDPDNGVLRARTRSPSGHLGPIATLSRPHFRASIRSPTMAMNRAGRAVVIWEREDGLAPVLGRTYSPTKGFGPQVTLSRMRYPPGPGTLNAAVDDRGHALASWEQNPPTNGNGVQIAADG